MAPVRLMTKLLVCLFPFTNGASAAIGDGGTRKNGDTCENDAPEQASMLSPLYDISALFQRKVAEVMTRLDPKSTATDYPNKDNPNKDSEDTALKDSGQDVKKKVFARPATQKLVDMNSTIDTLRALSEVTPEVISVVSGMIKTIADEIEPPIKADRKDTQDLVDTTISTLSTRTSDAVDKKKAAVAADNALNSCYAEQRRLLVLHETCRSEEETLMAEKDNTTNCNSVFLLPPEKGGFHPRSYIVRSDLQEDLVCDFSVGTCADVVGNRRANYDAWLRGLPIGPDGADKVSYDTAHAACEAAKGRLADKTASCNTMESNFENKHAHCLYALKEQQLAICMFGDSLHYKCETKQNYDTLILEIEGADNIHSESDRQSEWRGVSKLKCMLGEFVKGATFDNAMIATCTKLPQAAEEDFETEVGLIEKKEATYTWLISEENFSCSESAITFSGVIWAVPSGVVSTHVSSDYTKQTGHEYAFDSDSNSAPFTFCAPRSAHTTCGTDFVCAAGSQKPASTTCYVEGGCTAAACCVKAPVCGDHVVDDPDEDCDDGNFVPEDGCSNECTIEAPVHPGLVFEADASDFTGTVWTDRVGNLASSSVNGGVAKEVKDGRDSVLFNSDLKSVEWPIGINAGSYPKMTLEIFVYVNSISDSYGWLIGSKPISHCMRTILLHDSRVGGAAPSCMAYQDGGYDAGNAPTGRWIQMAATYDQSGSEFIVVDGVRSNGFAARHSTTVGNSMNVGSPIGGHEVDANVAVVRVYNTVLDDGELKRSRDAFAQAAAA